MEAQQIIDKLEMIPHPEGGYYAETYRSKSTVHGDEIMSIIYFLLEPGQVSYWHQIKQDEMWFHHCGAPLEVHCISTEGKPFVLQLGQIGHEENLPQQLVPAHTIFGSKMTGNEGYSLVSCVVAPAFKFEDFKLFKREELVELFPNLEREIDQLSL